MKIKEFFKENWEFMFVGVIFGILIVMLLEKVMEIEISNGIKIIIVLLSSSIWGYIRSKSEAWKAVLLFLVVVAVISVFGTLYPFVTTPLFEEKEPLTFSECNSFNGICIPVQQPCSEDRIEYGACSETLKCCVVDYCVKSGGRYKYEFRLEDNRAVFEKTCICPIGYTYKIQEGCTKWKS